MLKSKKNAFTLIELIAVLVIMAIIALIVTPLVMNIIRKARISADKRSIDAYGRSIELAIAGYLMDTGRFPTSIEQLTIEYSGDEVVCSTTKLNSDSSVYLAGCTVGGRSVEGYTYGKKETVPTPSYTAYNIGDHVSYNNVTYYVIEDSDTTNDTVKLLKENPLTKREMEISEDDSDGYVEFGSLTDYSTSTVKQYVDLWKDNAVKNGDTAIARLITFDELMDNLGYDKATYEMVYGNPTYRVNPEYTPSWVYISEDYHAYWTMSIYELDIWLVGDYGDLASGPRNDSRLVRPVLELNKSADITKLAS